MNMNNEYGLICRKVKGDAWSNGKKRRSMCDVLDLFYEHEVY